MSSSSCPNCSSVNCQCQEVVISESNPNKSGHHYVDTVADLRNIPFSALNRVAFVFGREAAFDSNGGVWGWDQNSTGVDDGTASSEYVAPFNIGGGQGRWRRLNPLISAS